MENDKASPETIFTFDHNPKYLCSRHGEQGPGLRFNIPERNIDKHYCMACVIDALDDFCKQLTEKKDDRS